MTAEIHEIEGFRNRNHVFKNRSAAGDFLARMLDPPYREKDVMVLAIPSGGVPVGIRIAEYLHAPFDLVIVRKLQIPGNPEAGFGAITQEGSLFLNEKLLLRLNLSESEIDGEAQRVKEELDRRNRLFRQGKPLPDLTGRRVILVDDGLASGFTMLASIYMVNKQQPQETVVAVPTAPRRTIDTMKEGVRHIYCPNVRETLSFAVASAYENWYDLDEKEVRTLLGLYFKRLFE